MKNPRPIPSREITDSAVYFNRRRFMRAGILAASAVGTGLVYWRLQSKGGGKVETPAIHGLTKPSKAEEAAGFRTTEPTSSFEDITHYNNY